MRKLVRSLAKGKKVLNAFCYTGVFTVAALAGGTTRVDSVDSSETALDLSRINLKLNGFTSQVFMANVFEFLRKRDLDYDFIVLDPPTFAKKKADVTSARRGYKDINRLVIQKISPGGPLLTFSCPYFVSERLFQQVVFEAGGEARRKARILGRHRLASDPPVNIFHPERIFEKPSSLYIMND